MKSYIRNEFFLLLRKDILTEFRRAASLGSLLLYVTTSLFICYISFEQSPGNKAWAALFWMIMVFAITNAVSRGFLQEGRNLTGFYQSMVSPVSLILSRLTYNGLLMVVCALLSLLIYVVLMGDPGISYLAFMPVLLLGVAGFSTLMTLISALASRAGQMLTLTAVLGFPLSFPLIIICLRLSEASMAIPLSSSYGLLVLLLALLDTLLLGLSIILFPYIWKD